MMLLKNFSLMTLISLLSICMTKAESTNVKSKGRKHGQLTESSPLNYYRFPVIRHLNHLLDKRYKCNWDRFRNKYKSERGKQSRYPTLDKIANRLDNQIDRELNKLKMTTADPFNQWEVRVSDDVTDRPSKYAYTTIGLQNTTKVQRKTDKSYGKYLSPGKNAEKGASLWKIIREDNYEKNDDDGYEDEDDENESGDNAEEKEEDDYIVSRYTDYKANKKGSTPDYMISGLWIDEQRDILSQTAKSNEKINYTEATASVSSLPTKEAVVEEEEEKEWRNIDKAPSESSLGKLVSRLRDAEDKKKKVQSTPYVAAHEHYEHVLRLGDCRTPKQKVVKVHEIHPDPSKSYSPSCTILHQCGDDTGCCRDLKEECKPKNTTKTTTLGKPQTVEKLYFVNHTECECQKRTNDLMPRDSEYHSNQVKKHLETKSRGEKRNQLNDDCVCPSKYSSRRLSSGNCICDCFDKQDDCLMLKKGKNHFSRHDKSCIQQSICTLPSCEFGLYMTQFGRCPTKRQQFRAQRFGAHSLRHFIT